MNDLRLAVLEDLIASLIIGRRAQTRLSQIDGVVTGCYRCDNQVWFKLATDGCTKHVHINDLELM